MSPKSQPTVVEGEGGDFLTDYDDDNHLAKKLNVSPRTIARWRRLRTGPATTYIGRVPFTAHRATREWLARRERKVA